MTITTLRALITGYLKQTDPSDFEIRSVDTLYEAINSARRKAERTYDFKFAEATSNLIIASAAAGGLTTASTISAVAISIKRIKNVLLPVAGGEYLPIEFMSYEDFLQRIRRSTGREAYSPTSTLAQLGVATENPIAYQQGQTIRLYPAAQFTFPITVHLDVVRFMPDYATANDTDFFLEFAPEFLQWQAILELNKVWKEFVPRQEGNVEESAVQAFADEAFQNLLQWDQSIGIGTSNPPVAQKS